MITILDVKTQQFLNFLNKHYGTEQECILSVFNCQDCIGFDEEGHTEQSAFIPEADLIMLTTENPEVIKDMKGVVVKDPFYIENYTLIKLAHEYAHFLQKYHKLEDSEDELEAEHIANNFAHKVVREFLNN